ncbi:MAG: acyclic terpene utilization AtuA family protein, partial [Chloroflexi bacterium]|nr:acyclic terpene utilization AtuA family protein [Chloroflexota bacterium]
VKVQGAKGKPRTKTLKTLIGVREGTVVEGEVGWAGWNSVEKAQMTITDLVKPRLARWEKDIIDIRYDIIGVNSTHGPVSPPPPGPLYETRLRIAVLTKTAELIEYLNDLFSYELFLGPLGSGGARCYSRPMLVMYPTLIPRDLVERNVKVTVEEVN